MTIVEGHQTKRAAVEHFVKSQQPGDAPFTIAEVALLFECHQSVVSTVVNDMLDQGYPFDVQKDEKNVKHYKLLSTVPDANLVGQRQKRAKRGTAKKSATKKASSPSQKAPAPKPVYPGLDDSLVVRGLLRDSDGDVTVVLTNGERSWTATIIGQTA